MLKHFSLIILSILATGCSIRSLDTQPDPLLNSDSFFTTTETEDIPLDTPWWEHLEDQKLKSLIEQAFAENLNLKIVQTRIAQAQSLTTQANALRLPQLDLGARSNQSWDDEKTTSSIHQFGAIINWELDILGRLKNSLSAREYELEATKFEYELTKLLLSSTIADIYYQTIEQKKQLSLLNEQLKTDHDLLELTERRFNAGVVSRVDVLQQSGQQTETKSLIPSTEASLQILENQLDILLGKVPTGKSKIDDSDGFPQKILFPAHGVPSDLLLRRPDLRAKKALLIAADADLGRAVLDRFPVVTIFSDIGSVTGNGPSGLAANIISSLLMPIIDWGSKRAEVTRRDAIYQERLLDYTQSYITAIAEVENLLFHLQKQKEFIAALKERLAILEATLEETRKRYTGGLTDYLPVLDAVQQLRSAQRDIVRQQSVLARKQAELFVSLGNQPIDQN